MTARDDTPRTVTRSQVAKVHATAKERGLNRIGCSAFQLVDGPDAGRWCGMGCELEGNELGDCLFTTQPVSYPNRGRATQGAMQLFTAIMAGREDIIKKDGNDDDG